VRSMTTTVEVSAAERYGYLDLTDDLRRAIKDAGVTDGAAIAFCEHTTAALLINEWEDGAMADLRRHLTEQIPHDGVYYAHDDFEVRTQNMNEDERKNGHAHVKAMMLSATSHAIPVVAGEPAFGLNPDSCLTRPASRAGSMPYFFAAAVISAPYGTSAGSSETPVDIRLVVAVASVGVVPAIAAEAVAFCSCEANACVLVGWVWVGT